MNGKTNGQTHTNGSWNSENVPPGLLGEDPEERIPQWEVSTLTKWAGKEIPPIPWLMEEWIIRGQCTGFYGIGGVRKTDWLLQLMIATALGKAFCGIPINQAPVLGLFCEDTDEEIARRANRIAGFYKCNLDQLWWCHYASLVGTQLTELISYDYGIPTPTATYRLVIKHLETFKPHLLVLDTAPDFFGGSENDRRQVAQFIRLLDSAAQKYDCAIIFSAQPSVRGRWAKTYESGSTGWENKVRARLTLHDPATEDDDDETRGPRIPSDRRILTRAKSNYAIPGEEIPLVIRDGGFLPENIDVETAPLRGPARDIAARSKFLDLLDAVSTPDRWVHTAANNKTRYAPAVFASHPDHGNFTERDFARAMKWLLDKKRIRLGTTKFAGKEYPCLISTPPNGDEP